MFGLGTTEIIVIVGGIVLLFGARKIPELMRGLGSGIKEFKKAQADDTDSSKHIPDNNSGEKK
jgi:sec-independent protein translocase protein TatA